MSDDPNVLDAFAFEPPMDTPKSLAISPNLEALLAHDERTRSSAPKLSDLSDRHSHFIQLPLSGSVEPEFANSLPPPPRGNRRIASRPNTPKTADRATTSPLYRSRTLSDSFNSAPNPYLNEIPKLPRLDPPSSKERVASGESPATTPSKIVTSLAEGSVHNGALEDSDSDHSSVPSLPTSPTSVLQRSTHSLRVAERRSSMGPRPYKTLPRVDRLLGKGRNIFSSHLRTGGREEADSDVSEVGDSLNSGVSTEGRNGNDQKRHQRSATGLSGDKNASSSILSQRPLQATGSLKRPPASHGSRSWHASISQPKVTRLEQSPDTFTRHHLLPDITTDIDPIFDHPRFNTRSPDRIHLSLESETIDPPHHSSISYQLAAPSQPSTSPSTTVASSSSYTALLSATITPKPNLHRHSSGSIMNTARKASPSPMSRLVRQGSPKPVEALDEPIPPTTNYLNAQDRADLVKKSRKLAKVFGATPGASALSNKDDSRPPIIAMPKHHRRSAASVSSITTPTDDNGPFSPWSTGDSQMYFGPNGRRHSTPDEFSFLNLNIGNDDKIGTTSPSAVTQDDTNSPPGDTSPESPLQFRASFMNLSEDDLSTLSPREVAAHPQSPSSSLAPTVMEQGEEEERRRKRERLAKLHRFLGSHVPAELVFGISANDPASLPSLASPLVVVSGDDIHKAWRLRRRSSSALPSEDIERLKEELNTEEKALKVFGVPPPQTLYMRNTDSSPTSPRSLSQPASPATGKNPNQSAYKGKTHRRIPTSDSTQQLIPSRLSNTSELASVYSHYQHSILTLNDIIDRGDRASLVDLHQYLQGDEAECPTPPKEVTLLVDTLPSPTSLRSDRRRSLPSSIMSVSTADFIGNRSTKPEANDFQVRRRRAAKLAQFFGVDYKAVMQEVLDSIERGVEDERQSGALQPEEAEALFQKLRILKKKKLKVTVDI
ncbi:hypothetical protein HWV62_25852 [Athelia sp. TMB]|nr:hypothetical protein HWV62_25852 [Athelia sp. TMB]